MPVPFAGRRGRRSFLHAALATGGVALLAACGREPATVVATPPPPRPPASPTPVPEPTQPPPTTAAPVQPTPMPTMAPPASTPTAVPAPPTAAPAAAPPANPAPCQFQLGFAAMRDLVGPATVGTCLEPERQVPGNGNTEQRTSNGKLVLRALDGRILFVGATQTWINRDGELATRPNDQRFAWEGDRQLVESLRNGGHVVYVRHGATDPNQKDTDPNNLANCSTQRNLTDAGRQQARAIGQAFKALELPVGQVMTSEYCRAREFAQLMFGRDADVEPSLVLPDPLTAQQKAQNTESLKLLFAQALQPGTNTFLVAHSPNVKLAMGVDLPAEGGAAVFGPSSTGPVLRARVLPDEWSAWAKALGRA
jgi:phosphohistidine phosphatase SixA